MEPFRLIPYCRSVLWGGHRLKNEYDKETELEPLAETWELSCHPSGCSIVGSGAYKGTPLSAYVQRFKTAVTGTRAAHFDDFPILIKLIDADENLSVQVHPSDEYALKHECQYGKEELWYILECEPGAYLYYGLCRPVSREEFLLHLERETVETLLNRVEVKPGDIFYITPGTLHAIGRGIVLAEIQQSSDVTYRVWDYNRPDKDGRLRPLHVEKALDVINFLPSPSYRPMACPDGNGSVPLVRSPYFTVHRLDIDGEKVFSTDGSTFHALLCADGSGELQSAAGYLSFSKGKTLFVPASCGEYRISGACRLLRTTLPNVE
ncbi:MAG: class I mannose-6-phosphate isomerase [Oscillospiraceae bacterium]|nr:class I mannose-6-phosphate isomerase [Oscillospiraceae bacterium]